MTSQTLFFPMKICYKTTNQDLEQFSQQIFVCFLTDKTLKGFDEGFLTGMILLDLQKAFDTIDHEILLQKLKSIKFSKGTIQWFRSYLIEQIFFC